MKFYEFLLPILYGLIIGGFITILIIPSNSEKLYPTKFEICKQDPKCLYDVDDIPNKVAEDYLKSKK